MIFLKTLALTSNIRHLFFTMLQVRRFKRLRRHMQMQGWWSTLLLWLRCLTIVNSFLSWDSRIVSVADAVVLEHRLGLTKTANFVSEVDPWCYPHDDSPALIGVKKYVQSVVAQATHAARSLSQFTDASITDFLLSPLLVKKGDRPNLVRKPKAQRTPKPRAVVTAAATVARKPSSQPFDHPIIEGMHLQNFRLPLPHPP